MRSVKWTALLALPCALALNDGLCRTPIMGFNSWTAYGKGVTEQNLLDTGTFLVSSGLRELGYSWVNVDDGWSVEARDAKTGKLLPDLAKFPDGIGGLVTKLTAQNLSFGIYTAESSVVCTGRPGSLFQETLDAATFVEWGVKLVKNDNCGEYSYGNTKFHVFADAVAALGSKMIISTEPFIITPNPMQMEFTHYWRTGNDIGPEWTTILNRIDVNDKWWRYAGPGHFNDPDMLQIGNGALTPAEQRAHFGLWAITKSTLILGTKLSQLDAAQLAIVKNKELIAVNQDALGVQAHKVAINGTMAPRFAGVAPCSVFSSNSNYADGVPGLNGARQSGMVFHVEALAATAGAFRIVANETGRCLGLRFYDKGAGADSYSAPMLLACDAHDTTQAWAFPQGLDRIGSIESVGAKASGASATALAVLNSTIFGAVHAPDASTMLDGAYGMTRLGLVPLVIEAPCTDRDCQDYDPTQSWYVSPRTGVVRLAAANANGYHCFEAGCYQLTSHLTATEEWCLAEVASISKYGLDPTSDKTGGVDVYAGPLSDGAYVFGLLNRGAASARIAAQWQWLETAGFGATTSACVKELYSGTVLKAQVGGTAFTVAPHDIAVLRVTPNASSC
jgi:hypothetical protein